MSGFKPRTIIFIKDNSYRILLQENDLKVSHFEDVPIGEKNGIPVGDVRIHFKNGKSLLACSQEAKERYGNLNEVTDVLVLDLASNKREL